MQEFCAFDMAANQQPKQRRHPFDSTLSGSDGPDLAAKLLTWYILEGHAGLNVSTPPCLCCSCAHHLPEVFCVVGFCGLRWIRCNMKLCSLWLVLQRAQPQAYPSFDQRHCAAGRKES